MHVLVNGVRLFFDVEGASLVPDGGAMREKPTLVLLHGGPGFDHSIYKPRFSALADIAQVVFLDHRGNGRSDPGPREAWTLAQWATTCARFVMCSVSRARSSSVSRSAAWSRSRTRRAIRPIPPS
jgi:proline iminopeptidase